MQGFRFSLTAHFRFRFVVLSLFVSNIGLLFADDAHIPSIALSGNQRFSTPEILLALQVDSRLLSELARTTEINERNEAIARTIHSGYVRSGNPDAKVSGEYSEKNSLYEIRIDEGVAIQKQDLEFMGVEPELANQLRHDLKKPARNHNEEWIPSLDALSLKVREIGKDDMVGKDADTPGLGGDKYSCPDDFPQIERIARDAFARNGYSRPRFTIEEQIDRSDRKQTLVFRVSDLGSPTKIHEVRFSGLQRHDANKLLDALDLRVGQIWTTQEMLRVQRALYESGRFQYHSVYTLPPLFEPSQAIVVVQVIESDRLPLFYESLSDEQEKFRQVALDLTESGPGASVYGEYFPRKMEKNLKMKERAMVQTLVSDQGFVFRIGTHIDSIPFGYISFAGMPKPDKTGKKTHFQMVGTSKEIEGPVLRVAPFALIGIEGKFSTDEQERSVFKSAHGAIVWKKDGSHVEKLELFLPDVASVPMIRLSHLDATETKKRGEELTNVGVRTSFVLRDTYTKISLLDSKRGMRCFSTGSNASDFSMQWKLFAACAVERLLGADSDQYALIRECILDKSRFASEFELKLTKFANSKTLGPVSIALALCFSKDNQHQCIALSQMAIKRLNKACLKAELNDFFARSESLRELTRALGNMIQDIPEDLISIVKELAPENQLFSKLEKIVGKPSVNFEKQLVHKLCESLESNQEIIGKWMNRFSPTSPAPLHWATQGKPQFGKEPNKGTLIKLPH